MIGIPFISAATGALGSAIGGAGNTNDVSQGMAAYNNFANQGTSTLQGGLANANAAYNPYTQAGNAGVIGELNAITNRQQATTPTVTQNTPQNAMNYLNPSAAYSMDQANKASTAAALAGGAAGGGMLKALSNNANQMAQTNYNNAYQQMLGSNAQTFNQQQQNYANNTDYQQQQIQNYGGLANRGLNAVTENQKLANIYNTGINSNLMNQAANAQTGWNKKGEIFNNSANQIGSALGAGISSLF